MQCHVTSTGEFKIPLQAIVHHADNNFLPSPYSDNHYTELFDYKLRQMNAAKEADSRSKKTHNDTGVFKCPTPLCNRIYSRRRSLNRHKQECGQLPRYKCTLCPYRGKRKDSLKSHMVHGHKIVDQQLQEQFMNRENVQEMPGDESQDMGEYGQNIGNVYQEWSREKFSEMKSEPDEEMNESIEESFNVDSNDKDETEDNQARKDEVLYQVDYRGQLKLFPQAKNFDQISEDKGSESLNNVREEEMSKVGSKTSPINLCLSK
ncbi:zinc finger E-box-binding homeobox 1-like isoform X1 [Diaphorina citri]|uniref:Zinc finger E-box-binding homeobox 1-like isoform X1 n=2 Tax=Diaphorina citri TaxID=121845 RepID=A0A1S3DQL0_DIACI|nr:zinc finger E-box-binding homeobox 1-like isoform X1 [Diaphorina citri]